VPSSGGKVTVPPPRGSSSEKAVPNATVQPAKPAEPTGNTQVPDDFADDAETLEWYRAALVHGERTRTPYRTRFWSTLTKLQKVAVWLLGGTEHEWDSEDFAPTYALGAFGGDADVVQWSNLTDAQREEVGAELYEEGDVGNKSSRFTKYKLRFTNGGMLLGKRDFDNNTDALQLSGVSCNFLAFDVLHFDPDSWPGEVDRQLFEWESAQTYLHNAWVACLWELTDATPRMVDETLQYTLDGSKTLGGLTSTDCKSVMCKFIAPWRNGRWLKTSPDVSEAVWQDVLQLWMAHMDRRTRARAEATEMHDEAAADLNGRSGTVNKKDMELLVAKQTDGGSEGMDENITQVTSISYVSAKKTWAGFTALGQVIRMSRQAVYEHFEKSWLDTYVVTHPDIKFKIPVGNLRNANDDADSDLPLIQHRQTTDTCVFFGLASAMSYFGDRNFAVVKAMIGPADQAIKNKHKAAKEYKDGCYTAFHYLRDTVRFQLTKYAVLGIRGRGFDPTTLVLHQLAVCVLLASDGSTNHCVTIMHGLIFDACEKHSLPLSNASLDKCVKVDSADPATFVAVEMALVLEPKSDLVNAMKRLPASRDWRL